MKEEKAISKLAKRYKAKKSHNLSGKYRDVFILIPHGKGDILYLVAYKWAFPKTPNMIIKTRFRICKHVGLP